MDFRLVPVWAALIVAMLMSAAALTDAVPELKIVQPEGGAKHGDELVIRCTIKNIGALEILQIVRKIDGVETKIVSNVYISKQFLATGRYNLTAHTNDFKAMERMAEVTIKDVQGKDGGDIGCGIMSSDVGAYETVLIHVPVESVDILYKFGEGANASYMSATDGEVLQLKQGQLATIICRVKVEGSDFDPVVDITLDDKDATDVFVSLPPKRNRVDTEGFLEMDYTGEWEYKTSEHDVSLNGQNMTCSAEKKAYPVVSKTVAMRVVYEPVLDCAKEHARELGTKEAKITCKARMNPLPETVVWSWGSHPNRTVLTSDEAVEGRFSAEHKVLEDDHHEFSLVIDEVTEDDFRKYKLEIANSIGTKEHDLSLLEVEELSDQEVISKPSEVGDPASVGKQVENEANVLLSTALLLVAGLLLSLIHAS